MDLSEQEIADNPKLKSIGRQCFIKHYIVDQLEWKMCAKVIKLMITSKLSLSSVRKYLKGCWIEDTSLDGTLNLVFSDGKGPTLMLPDQIGFNVFRIVKPLDVLLCGHFMCEFERLKGILESVQNVTRLEIYKKTTNSNAQLLLSKLASNLRYLACDVGLLSDFLRRPIELDRYLAYHHSDVKSSLSWILKAISAKCIDLGIKPFTDFSLRIQGPIREELTTLIVTGSFKRREEIYEFLTAIKTKTPNLSLVHMNFYMQAEDTIGKERWNEYCRELMEFGSKLQSFVDRVVLNANIQFDNVEKLVETSFFDHPISINIKYDDFMHRILNISFETTSNTSNTSVQINLIVKSHNSISIEFESLT